jgi:CheY-like chemotaxis protein
MEKRLLIVDDECEFAEFVRRVALDLGFEVEVALSAKEFMKLYRTMNPNIIVMDIVMPEMDGIELIRWLAENECQASIIVATGYVPSYAELTEELGTAKGVRCIETLHKPVRVADLRNRLCEVADISAKLPTSGTRAPN